MNIKEDYTLMDEYIKKFLNGDESAFDYIYNNTYNIVHSIIYSIMRERSSVDDISQDVFMKVLDKISNYKIGTNFYAWITTIAKNISINAFNREKKEDLIDPIEGLDKLDIPREESKAYLATTYLEGTLKIVFINKIFLGLKCSDIDRVMAFKPRQSEYLYKKAIAIVKENL